MATPKKKKQIDDAWKQYADLRDKYSTRTKVRSDIIVQAHALDRGVELTLVKEDLSPKHGRLDPHRFSYRSTGSRNVSTMRELAEALLDACDFVDASNQVWASKHMTPEDLDALFAK